MRSGLKGGIESKLKLLKEFQLRVWYSGVPARNQKYRNYLKKIINKVIIYA